MKLRYMFRRNRWSWWHRPLAAFFAVWFLVSATDMGGLHACAMHGGTGAASMDGMAMADMAGHADHAPAANHSSDSQHDSGTHTCTCIGACCVSASPLAPSTPQLALVASIVELFVVPFAPQTASRAGWIDYVLPFANAPPRASLI